MDADINEIISEALGKEDVRSSDPREYRVYRTGSSIELNKTSTGKYGWTIKVNGIDDEDILNRLNKVNLRMEQRYGIGRVED